MSRDVDRIKSEEWARIVGQLSTIQREALTMFNNGYYINGDNRVAITSLVQLHEANQWIMGILSRDHRPGVIADVHITVIIPAFTRHAMAIVVGAIEPKRRPYE